MRILFIVCLASVFVSGCSDGYPSKDLTKDPRTHVPSREENIKILNAVGLAATADGAWSYTFAKPCSVEVTHAPRSGASSRARVVPLQGYWMDLSSVDSRFSVILKAADGLKDGEIVVYQGDKYDDAHSVLAAFRRVRGGCPATAG
jgi:hypothetical protein